METNDFPGIPPGIVEELERRFPHKCPGINDSEREIFHYAGKVALVGWLRVKYDQQRSAGEQETNTICV